MISRELIKSKAKAALIHFSLSAIVVGSMLAVIFFLWYPHPYFEVRGAGDIVKILIGVDLVLGPLLTLIIFRKGKPRLKFDMSIIVIVQLAAFIYGVNAIYEERPYFMVYAVDRFTLLAEKDVDFSEIVDPSLAEKPEVGPVMVVASQPTDIDEQQTVMFEVILENKPDIDQRPKYWSPYQDHIDEILDRTRPLSEMLEFRIKEKERKEIARAVKEGGGDIDHLGFVPIEGKNGDFAVVLDMENADVIDVVNVDPWIDDPVVE